MSVRIDKLEMIAAAARGIGDAPDLASRWYRDVWVNLPIDAMEPASTGIVDRGAGVRGIFLPCARTLPGRLAGH